MRALYITGEITVFKTPAISKIVHLALVKVIPNSVSLELDKIKSILFGKMAILKLNRTTFVKIIEMVF